MSIETWWAAVDPELVRSAARSFIAEARIDKIWSSAFEACGVPQPSIDMYVDELLASSRWQDMTLRLMKRVGVDAVDPEQRG